MDLQIVLVLVVASGSLCEGVTPMQLPLHGVNGHTGKPRPSQSFRCTVESDTKQQSPSPTRAPMVCPPNMTPGNCTEMCHATCQGGTSCGTVDCKLHPGCVCHPRLFVKDGDCVPVEDCGCYFELEGDVIAEGDIYVTEDCNQTCTCSNQELKCTHCDAQICSSDCSQQSFPQGPNDTDRDNFLDCYDAFKTNSFPDGVYFISPTGWTHSAFPVYCDMTTAGGGWTVFQRRGGKFFSFHRSWENYKKGFFGNLQNYWLGNEKLFHLTEQKNYTLRVEIITDDDVRLFQEYSLFKLADEIKFYRITALGKSDGTAGDGMRSAKGQPFSTKDMDNDGKNDANCAWSQKGGWWFSADECKSCWCGSHDCERSCTTSNLNARYWDRRAFSSKTYWNGDYVSVKSSEMKIRPSK